MDEKTKKEEVEANPDRYIAQTDQERQLVKLGVPSEYWYASKSDIRFRETKVHGFPLSAKAQRQWMMRIAMDPRRDRILTVASSDSTDEGALHMAYCVLRKSMSRGYEVGVIDLGQDRPYFENYPHFLVIHNLKHNASPERCERVRDLLIRFRHCSRMVVVAGATNPFEFSIKKINLYPRVAMRLTDRKPNP
jgi:hypothetical protein